MTVPEQLRKLAAQLREHSKKRRGTQREKCAQVITAAQGLTRLRETIYGEQK